MTKRSPNELMQASEARVEDKIVYLVRVWQNWLTKIVSSIPKPYQSVSEKIYWPLARERLGLKAGHYSFASCCDSFIQHRCSCL